MLGHSGVEVGNSVGILLGRSEINKPWSKGGHIFCQAYGVCVAGGGGVVGGEFCHYSSSFFNVSASGRLRS